MRCLNLGVAALAATFATVAFAQQTDASANGPDTTLKVNSRAVLVDVIVTDHNGNPVRGLKQEDFRVLEQGKHQSISYFEEHSGPSFREQEQQKMEFPHLPPNVFTNFSPLPTPPVVNVLLLDSLNTPIADQIYLKKAAQNYLKSLKPGTRLAIFTMSLRLSFIQGFSDDPTVLARAMGYRKNDRSEPAVLVKSQGETDAQDTVVEMMSAMEASGNSAALATAVSPQTIEAFQQFMQETHYAQDSDREYRTMENLNQLAAFLGSFPGRKNVIWMSGAFPLSLFGDTSMRFEGSVAQTINLLAASRVAIYPVDVRGAATPELYTAENRLDPTAVSAIQTLGPPPGITNGAPNAGMGVQSAALSTESQARNSSNSTMDMLAEQTGGKAFYNQNNLERIIDNVTSHSLDFYTLSYSPTNETMDGGFRKIEVKVGDNQQFHLSYRQGYYARDEALPGAAQSLQQQEAQHAAQDPTTIDPLKPFMTFGMPQSEQILYKALIQHVPAKPDLTDSKPSLKGPTDRYSVDFSVDLNDLDLKLDSDGLRKGTLNVSWMIYDKYGQTVSREDHLVKLNIKPDVWAVFQKTGLQLHGQVQVPKGQYWLRTGIYDQGSRKVGTMEVPFSSVQDNVAAKQ